MKIALCVSAALFLLVGIERVCVQANDDLQSLINRFDADKCITVDEGRQLEEAQDNKNYRLLTETEKLRLIENKVFHPSMITAVVYKSELPDMNAVKFIQFDDAGKCAVQVKGYHKSYVGNYEDPAS